MEARFLESIDLAPEVRQFLFEVPGVESLPFTPGQFVSFSANVMGKNVVRPYSIAAIPHGNRFELCLNRVKEGVFSPFLFELKPGDTLPMTGPLGFFVPRTPFRDSVLVATGTGIAPFRAFLRDQNVLNSGARLTLLFGVRYQAGLLYRAEFESLAASHSGFRFLPTITRPDSTWNGRTGRVQHHLDDALEGRRDLDVYICGLAEMVDDVRAILKAKEFDRKQIIAEKYD